MKRFFLTLLFSIISVTFVFAQLKVSSGNSSVEVVPKRAIEEGNDVFVDIVVTCHNKWNKIELAGQDDGVWAPIVFDDEGNAYKGTGMTGRLQFEVDDSRQYYGRVVDIAPDVPRKIRLIVKGVDEYASSFSSIKIPYFGNGSNATTYNIIIKNLPITRE